MLQMLNCILLVVTWRVEHFLVRIKWVLLLLSSIQAVLWVQRRLLRLYITSSGFRSDF